MMLINGQAVENIAASDRAVQFGDGCFTTGRLWQGEVVMLEAHLKRLREACHRLFIHHVDWEALRQEMMMAAATRDEGVIKVILSRGSGGRGYSARGCEQPTRIVSLSAYPAHYHQMRQSGAKLALSTIRLGRNPLLAGIKHLNRLEQVLIRTELEQTGADEALVLDTEGQLVECCAANLFWRSGKQVFTPILSDSGVNGIQRQWVIARLKQLGNAVAEVRMPPDVLTEADEVLITNALMPILPVSQIENRFYRNRELFYQLCKQDDLQGTL
ncbi:aminodeoxychorismate lyase [Pantoea sp. MBD-2R]|uniref:aminodeoxychorismate lyase n=1 Tax=Pantoea sp. MBD-2R TaxID=3141540 RepID=UPI0031843BE0